MHEFSDVISKRNSDFSENDLFDPCDLYMTFEVKPFITLVAMHPWVLVTKYGLNQLKYMVKKSILSVAEETRNICHRR